jgi:hypothetical protein
VQDRLDEVLGLNWKLELDHETLDRLEDDYKNRPQWLARCRATITVLVDQHPSRQGYGVAQGLSSENVLLTAQVTAIKKAGHQFGIGRELWYPARRVFVDLAPRLVPLAYIVLDEDPDINGHEAEKNLKQALIGALQRWRDDDSSVPRPEQGDTKGRVRLVHAWLSQAGGEPESSSVQDLARAVLKAAGEES